MSDVSETWRSIPGYPYDVSDAGHVRNAKTLRPIKPYVVKSGYHKVWIRNENGPYSIQLHRLVWSVWRGPIPAGYQINHLDFDRINNAVSNLECVTPLENMRHSQLAGRHPRGTAIATSKLNDALIVEIRSRCKRGEPQRYLAKCYGVSQGLIGHIARRNIWKHVP